MVVHAAIRDMEHLKSVISNPFNRAVHVLRVETSMIFNRRTQHAMPLPEISHHGRAGARPYRDRCFSLSGLPTIETARIRPSLISKVIAYSGLPRTNSNTPGSAFKLANRIVRLKILHKSSALSPVKTIEESVL